MDITVLEMPLDFGANRHGSDMGPSAIRLAGLKEMIHSLGHKTVKHFSPMQIPPQEYQNEGNPKAKYLGPIVTACNQLATEVEAALSAGSFPLVLGGDHSIVLGTLAGVSSYAKTKGLTTGVLYVDAHGDFNTCETTLTGNIHGMCRAASCGYGIDELVNLYKPGRKIDAQDVFYMGLRDIDPEEKLLMKKAGVKALSMTDIDRTGFKNSVRQAVDYLKDRVDFFHISIDMDALDPMFAPGVGIPLPGGLSYREILLLAEEVAATGKMCSAEIVEVNPVLDIRSQTAKMAVEIIGHLLGKTFY